MNNLEIIVDNSDTALHGCTFNWLNLRENNPALPAFGYSNITVIF